VIEHVTIVGTGLIGASVGLALREAGFGGEIAGWDPSRAALDAAVQIGAVAKPLARAPDALAPAQGLVLLAGPVLSILDWMERLAPLCGEETLISDVGSTKTAIHDAAKRLYNRPGRAWFLPGHPMAGKESGGASLAEAGLFRGAAWLFTSVASEEPISALEVEWRDWVRRFGARVLDLDAARHDEICAWVSHLPQMLATGLAALLEERFGDDPAGREEIAAIGGRALREMTRLGASPYSMWRDVALSNTEPIGETLLAL
jgi:prephenate dehydrogenase